MANFVFVMQHSPTPEQLKAVERGGRVAVELADKELLVVPDDPSLQREWFVRRAEEIIAVIGGVGLGDAFHAMGQPQLANALNAAARDRGAILLESVTTRESVEAPQPDGTVKKTAVFRFSGFRPVFQF